MNIGVDIRGLASKRLTGIGNYIVNSLQYIFEIDKTNDYYLFSSGLKQDIDSDIKFSQSNVHYVHINIPNKLLNFGFVSGLGKDINEYFPVKLDLLWLPNIIFCKFDKNIPTVLSIHDLSFFHSREFYSLKRRFWHYLINVSKLADAATKIISVSDNTARDISRFLSVSKDKVEVIYPGVKTYKMDKQKAEELSAKFKLNKKYFIFVGTLEPRKNIQALIKAFDRYYVEHKDVDLVIVGDKGWIYRKLLKQVKQRKYIRYLGYITGATKDALYFLSQGLIWPSFYEGFGFPPLEAVYQRIPVIASYKTSLPEVMKQQALYVDPYNPSDIYQVLKQLTIDSRLKNELIKSAEDFPVPTWPKQAKKMIKVFENFKNNNENSN